MKTIKLLLILIIFSACENNMDDFCDSRCSEVIATETNRTVRVTLKNQCSGEITYITVGKYKEPILGTVICKN